MRNPYFAAVSSFRIWPLLLVVGFWMMIAVPLMIGDWGRSSPRSLHEFSHAAVLYGWLLMWLSVGLVHHLKQMLGSPLSRVTPKLQRAHLTVAVVILMLLTCVFPLVIIQLFDSGKSLIAIVACALALFSVSSLLAFRWVWCYFLVAYAPALPMFLRWDSFRIPTSMETAALLALAAACLALLYYRLSRFHEEMHEHRHRFPLFHQLAQRSSIPVSAGPGGWSFHVPLPRNLRAFRGVAGSTQESPIARGLHWNAARRSLWSAAFMGATVSLVTIGFLYPLYGSLAIEKYFTSPMVFVFGVFPALIVLGPQARRYLVMELMRPYSRAEYIRGVAFVLVASCLICWAFIFLVPYFGAWVVTREIPGDSEMLAKICLSLCTLPLLFGVSTWPCKRQIVVFMIMISVTSGFIGINEFTRNWMTTEAYAALLATLLIVGLAVTWFSYRRWLTVDFE
jgi:hypothetical protein